MDDKRFQDVSNRFSDALTRAKQAGASGAKFNYSEGDSISVGMTNGKMKYASASRGMQFSINVIVAGKMGSIGGNHIEQFDEMLSRALEMAKHGSAVHYDEYPQASTYATPKTFCPRAAAVSRADLVEAITEISEGLIAHDDKLFVDSGGSRSTNRSLMMTSGGVVHDSHTSNWGIHGGGQQTQGTDILHFGSGRSWKELNDLWDPKYVINRCIRDLTLADEIVEAPAGKMKAFIDPGVLAAFLSPMVEGINGRTVAMGGSPLADKIGQRVLDPVFTISDDPHMDFGSGVVMDGEGVPTECHTVVDEGELKMFLYDYDTACMENATPTGGSRFYDMVVAPGVTPHEELLASIDEGVYIRGMLGFGQGNIINGDFSANVSPGYLIREGKVVGRIKDTMVAGNLYDLLGENVQLSSDYDKPGRLPWALIDGVSVSTGG
jgi:PmbA protein